MNHVNKNENYHLVPCVYDESRQKQIVKELVNGAPVINIKAHPSYGKPPFFNMSFGDAALFLAPIIKSESSKEEKEWRLISAALSYPDTPFRRGNFSLIPYWEFDLDLEQTIDSVIIGPTPEEDLSERAVWGFLLSVSMDNLHLWTNIKHSKIPFRKI